MPEAAHAPNLSRLPVFDPDHEGAGTVVIETSKGSRNNFGFVRPIGVVEARQRRSDDGWTENNRYLGVPLVAQATQHIDDMSGLRPQLLDEIEAFFVQYNRMRGVDFEVVARGGPERARDLIAASRVATVTHG